MAKQPAKNTNITINSVALESYVEDWNFNVKQANADVTGLDQAGPRRVADNYDYGLDLGGAADFAAGLSDATIFGLLGSAGVALDLDPTGVAAGASNPHYTAASMVLEEYSLSGKVGGGVMFKAKTAGNAALVRAVA